MDRTIVSVTKNFVNLIYPLRCAACGKSLNPVDEFGVCRVCLNKIRRNPKPYSRSCGLFFFEKAYSACLYEGALKELIRLFKYKGRISLAKILSKLMIDFIKENDEILYGIDIITFVPIQARRLRERGFNQSRALALNLSKEFGIPVTDALKKTKLTKPQNELTRNERLTNLKNAFKARGRLKLKGNAILLIDDVMTTGATLSECSKVLLDAGAESVRCLTLARGI